MPNIEVILSPDGSVKVDAVGFKGKTCEEATKFLETLGEKKSTRRKPEYYQETVKLGR